MKKISIIVLILVSSISIAQKGLVEYGYIEAFANGNGKGPDYNAYMIFDKEQSYYVTAKDSLEKAERINEQKAYVNDDENSGSIYNGLKVSIQGDQVVNNLKSKSLISNLYYRNQIYIKEITPVINWKITKEVKKIGKFNCKKATATFRGRDYTAWFSPEIPLSFGPWKLNGLPGLILEAYDKNKSVYWYFKSVEYPTKNKNKPSSIRKAKGEGSIKFISYEDFKKVQDEEQKLVYEKGIIMKKKFPEIEIELPKLNQMFIECE